jgi:hypothetical protein
MDYDSSFDTAKHIARVGTLINKMISELCLRNLTHDSSKLKTPEKEIFDVFTPKLKDSTYGSEEYKTFLKEMKVALDHHYKNNRHHPEYHADGINNMDLIDILEMFCDWKAASERHVDGDIFKSIEINKKRFNMSLQLEKILINTAARYF